LGPSDSTVTATCICSTGLPPQRFTTAPKHISKAKELEIWFHFLFLVQSIFKNITLLVDYKE